MITIRPFNHTDEEYARVIQIANANWPDHPETVADLKHQDATRNPKHFFRREVFELNGEIVGFGMHCEAWWHEGNGRYFMYADVHPHYQGRGFGSVWYDQTMPRLLERQATIIGSDTREDKATGIHFLEHRGFKRIMREPVSALNVPDFDFEAFAWTESKMVEKGIEIITLAELSKRDPHWKVHLHDLTWAISQDVPQEGVPVRRSQEEFEKQFFGRPNYTPESQFVAIDTKTDALVGYSSLWPNPEKEETQFTGLTGVVRNHRRKGIATAMKVKAIGYATQQGATEIVTDNEENNPMFQINLQLGFKDKPAWLIYSKEIEK